MNDQNNQMVDEMLSGLDDSQKEEFQKLAKETLAARVLERIMSVMGDDEIEEMKALPENDASAVEVFLQSKFTKEELEQMAREELGHIKERMVATLESSIDNANIQTEVSGMFDNISPTEDSDSDDEVASV